MRALRGAGASGGAMTWEGLLPFLRHALLFAHCCLFATPASKLEAAAAAPDELRALLAALGLPSPHTQRRSSRRWSLVHMLAHTHTSHGSAMQGEVLGPYLYRYGLYSYGLGCGRARCSGHGYMYLWPI